MLDFVDGWVPERRDMLIDRFGVDMDWRVNQLSDGRKRRVQLLLAFARPATVLLLDEVTTDLDVLARQTLLDFLREVCLIAALLSISCTCEIGLLFSELSSTFMLLGKHPRRMLGTLLSNTSSMSLLAPASVL